MTKNTMKIIEGFRTLAEEPYEIVSGTVVTGSLNMVAYTVSVRQTGGVIIENVMLHAVSNEGNGIILIPEDDSDVIIGSIDGPGEWALLRAGKLTKGIIKIGSVKCEVSGADITIQNGEAVFKISDNLFKMNTPSESLYGLLNDLMTALTLLTVTVTISGTPSTSGVPNNVTTFTNLLSRLNNLLNA